LEGLSFQERRWSFIARTREPEWLLVKVPKASATTTLGEALAGREERRLAGNEFAALSRLVDFATDRASVVVPVESAHPSVVTTRFVPGLRPLLRRLDGVEGDWAPSLLALGEWLAGVHDGMPNTVVDGFLLENVGVDASGHVWIADPNELRPGDPMEDVGRMAVMILAGMYTRAERPKRLRVEQADWFLRAYGRDRLRGDALADAAYAQVNRIERELVIAGRRRFGHTAARVIKPGVLIYTRMLRHRLDELLERLPQDVQFEARYSRQTSAATYRRQQERGIRDLRGWVLTSLETRAIAAELRTASPQRRILDVPGGTGKLWPLLERTGVPVVAGDQSIEMLRAGDARPGIARVVLDAEALPFADGAFDVVVCLRLLHRLPPEQRAQILAELARASSDTVIASYSVTDGLYALRYWVRSALMRSTIWAPHPVTRAQIVQELAAAGLQVGRVRSVGGLLSNEVVVSAGHATTNVRGGSELCCPACRTALVVSDLAATCPTCECSYPVIDSIPVLRLSLASGAAEQEIA
jgi:uncharacterized protein YbaR (Trm112 family)